MITNTFRHTAKMALFLTFLKVMCVVGTAHSHPSQPLFDWVPLPSNESLCGGYYLPQAAKPSLTEHNWSLPMDLVADHSEFTLEGGAVLSSNVKLRQGEHTLYTDKLILTRDGPTSLQSLEAIGNIRYLAPGLSIYGEYAKYDHVNQVFDVDNAYYRWYARHARGFASHIQLDREANIFLYGASYTTCAPLKDTWMVKAGKLSLYPKRGRATGKHLRLNLLGFPVLYFPYFNYPIDNKRHSGFLFPSYGSTSNSGFELTLPYYWNIAPNYDLTLSGKWLTERGVEGQTKFRYLFSNSEGIFRWHFLPNDRKYALFQEQNLTANPGGLSPLDPRVIALETGNNRHALNYYHHSQWQRRWVFNVVFDYVSDDNYFVDLGNDIQTASTIHLPQHANLYYYGENWTHYLNVEEYQVLQPFSKPINEEIYKRQPQWVFKATYPNLPLNLSFSLIGEAVNYTHLPQLITQTSVTTGQRYHLRPKLSLPIEGPWYTLKPRIQADWLKYDLTLGEQALIEELPGAPSRVIPLVDVDGSVFFERLTQFRHTPLIQTLEPRLYYLYVPYREQNQYPDFDSGIINFSYEQLFRDNRFSGRDRIGDANQLSISLTSRLLDAKFGHEWLRASIGQIFYFERQRVTLCEGLLFDNTCPLFEEEANRRYHSDLIAQVNFNATEKWSGSLFWQWDSSDQSTEQAAFLLQYRSHSNKLFNLYYYWLKHDLGQINDETGTIGSLNQVDLSLLWPLSLHWELISVWRYNFQQKQTVEVLGGIEYNGCCLALQLIGSRYRQSNNFFYPQANATGVFAQVVFKGLSALPLNNPDGKLKEKIPGYTPLSERQKWLSAQPNLSRTPKEIPLY